MSTRKEVAMVMAFLGSLTGKEPTVEQIEAYNLMLAHLPADVLQRAAQRAAAEHQYPTIPPVGLILKHAGIAIEPPTALAEAWLAVRAFAARWEYWLTEGLPTHEKTLAKFKADRAALPPLARKAADAYGWPALVATETGIAFAHFRQLYESLDGPARREAALPESLRTTPIAARSVASIIGGLGAMPELPAK